MHARACTYTQMSKAVIVKIETRFTGTQSKKQNQRNSNNCHQKMMATQKYKQASQRIQSAHRVLQSLLQIEGQADKQRIKHVRSKAPIGYNCHCHWPQTEAQAHNKRSKQSLPKIITSTKVTGSSISPSVVPQRCP